MQHYDKQDKPEMVVALRMCRRWIFDELQEVGHIPRDIKYKDYVGYSKDGDQARNMFHIIDSALGECQCNWCKEELGHEEKEH